MSTMPVPATPVVLIEISGASVKVNGEPVLVEEGVSLYQAGVHAAAHRVAQVLDRPVRAIATDPSSRTQLVVHPDGTVTDVEELERFTSPLAVVTGASAEAAEAPAPQAGPALAPVLHLAPVDHSHDVAVVDDVATVVATAAAQVIVDDQAAAEPAGTEPVGPRRSSRRLLQLLLAFIVVAALVLTGVVLATRGSKPAPVDASAAPAPTPSVVAPAPQAPPARTVRVLATAGLGVVRLRVTASRLPAAAVIVVDPAGAGAPRRLRVHLTKAAQPITVKRISPGKATWRVDVVDGARAAMGTVLVSRPPATPPAVVSSPAPPAYTPPVSQAPAPSHHHSSSNSGPVGPGGGGATGPVR